MLLGDFPLYYNLHYCEWVMPTVRNLTDGVYSIKGFSFEAGGEHKLIIAYEHKEIIKM